MIRWSGAEGVRHIGQAERDAIGLAGLERNRLLEALAELSAERLAANQLLIGPPSLMVFAGLVAWIGFRRAQDPGNRQERRR